MLGIVTGILMMILGGVAVTMPFRTFLGIGWMLGGLFLVQGIEMAVLGFKQKKKDVWQCVWAILVSIGGLILLFNASGRFLADVFVSYLIGAYVLIYGGKQAYEGYKVFSSNKMLNGIRIACGVISCIAGILVIFHPLKAMFSIGLLIGFSVIMQGINIAIAGATAIYLKKRAKNS